jgi:hypothetical protein
MRRDERKQVTGMNRDCQDKEKQRLIHQAISSSNGFSLYPAFCTYPVHPVYPCSFFLFFHPSAFILAL